MYLNALSYEQKELFLDLCIYASLANGVFDEREKEYINQYCDEMKINDVRYSPMKSVDETIDILVEISSKEELKIVDLELTALLMCDNEYDNEEIIFMDKFIKKANIPTVIHNNIVRLLNELTELYSRINNIISE